MERKDFENELNNAICDRDEQALRNLERIAQVEESLHEIWEDHSVLTEAIKQWKESPITSKELVVNDNLSSMVEKKIADLPVVTVEEWEPIGEPHPFRNLIGFLTATAAIVLCGFFVWKISPQQSTPNPNETIANLPNDNPLNNVLEGSSKKQFSGLLLEAGKSYGSLAEATADSVKQNSDILPPVDSWTSNLTGSVQNKSWSWNNKEKSKKKQDSNNKKGLLDSLKLFLEEIDRG